MIKTLTFLILFSLVYSLGFTQIAITTLTKVTGTGNYQFTLGENNDKVVIGKSTDSTTRLSPRIEFSKWGGEEKLSIEYPGLSSLVPTVSNGVVTIGNTSTGFYVNRVDDENLKFGIIWKKKPTSNNWSVNLTGYEDLDIIYQPPLSVENPTGRKLMPDGVTYFDVRPENVVGSYAIYHKEKVNHEIGKTNYGTGKMFHWYRPRFIDANNNWTWGTLNYKDGVMTETCPQPFLDTATYPVKSNVDVGYKTGGASTDWCGSTQTWYAKVNGTPAGNGTLNYVHIWVDVAGVVTAKFAVYSDTGSDYPGNRLAVDATAFAQPTTKADQANPTDFSLAITTGTQYWLAVGNCSNEVYTYWDSGTDNNGYNTEVLPTTAQTEPFDVYNYTSTKNSVYFTYTASGGAARRRIMVIE